MAAGIRLLDFAGYRPGTLAVPAGGAVAAGRRRRRGVNRALLEMAVNRRAGMDDSARRFHEAMLLANRLKWEGFLQERKRTLEKMIYTVLLTEL